MVNSGLLGDEDFSQDGTRIKANAGFNNFRSENGIKQIESAITKLIKEIEEAETITTDPTESAKLKRQKLYEETRLKKTKQAARELNKHKQTLTENAKKNHDTARLQKRLDNARASLTDPEVRKMKMGDGGFRLAYNVQLATAVNSRVIFGVNVVNILDSGTMALMVSHVYNRIEKLGLKKPKYWIADSAYSYQDDLNAAYDIDPNLKVVASPNKKLKIAKVEKSKDKKGVRLWRRFIGTNEFKKVYSKRCNTAEFSNMLTKVKGLGNVLVRGIDKVTSMCLLHAIAFNMVRFWDLSN